jgi:hypothetical protein
MVKLTTLGSSFEAKVLAARLGSEGVVCELRGGVDGPYPFGPVHVYVEERTFDLARELLVTEPIDLDDDEPGVRRLGDRPSLARVLVVIGIVVLAAASIARVMTSLGDPPAPSPPPPTTSVD